MGAPVGCFVMGADVTGEVGNWVKAIGATDGFSVVAGTDGWPDGVEIGSPDGAPDGVEIGAPDGTPDGVEIGTPDGSPDGAVIG